MDAHDIGALELGSLAAPEPAALAPRDSAPAHFQVPRPSLIEIIKLALTDLHDRRRRAEAYPHVERLEEKIRCWEDALVWLKELSEPSVSLRAVEDPSQGC